MEASEIIIRLCECGYQAYTVGGCVRDHVLGYESEDDDIVTNADSEEIQQIFKEREVRVIGKSFQVTLVDGYEVATYRIDRYNGLSANNGSSSFAETLVEDLQRRDLTYNAMAFCEYTGDVIDPFGGREDLKNGVTKFVGNPYDRINEDPNRIIRACRFKAKTGTEFEHKTLIALKENAYLIENYVASERIRTEILKAMKIQNASLFFYALEEIGALKFIFPSLVNLVGLGGGRYHGEKDVFQHCMIVGDSLCTSEKFGDKNSLLKLSGYLHDIGKFPARKEEDDGNTSFLLHEEFSKEIISEELRGLTFSTEETKYISNLAYLHMRDYKNIGNKGVRKLIKTFKDNDVDYFDFLFLRIADRRGNLLKKDDIELITTGFLWKVWKELDSPKQAFDVKSLLVNGDDVINILGLKPSRKIGAILNYLFDLVLDDPDLNERETLINIISGLNPDDYTK